MVLISRTPIDNVVRRADSARRLFLHKRVMAVMRFYSFLTLLFLFTVVAPAVGADGPLLKAGDRVAVLGGTFVERMQLSGAVEAQLQCRQPDWRLSFRNLGWSGDDVHGIARKVFSSPEDGFKRLVRDVDTAEASVVLVAYGFSEASDGAEAIERFERGLRRLIGELKTEKRRVILLTPVAMPGYRVKGYDQSISQCCGIITRVGKELDVPVVSVGWQPQKDELNESRLLPSEKGYANYADKIADQLVGGQPCETSNKDLQRLISAKDQLFFHRYRPQNETYLFLFRKHEQGNNAVEIPQFDPLVREADEAIWKAASK